MRDSLKEGLSTQRTITVDKARTIDFLGEELRVYATPELVRDIEFTCLQFLGTHCDDGEHSVGMSIDLTHSAATPLGMTVTIEATVSAVEGRQVTFEVVARDDLDECCRCTHKRFVVAIDRLRERLAAKKARLAS